MHALLFTTAQTRTLIDTAVTHSPVHSSVYVLYETTEHTRTRTHTHARTRTRTCTHTHSPVCGTPCLHICACLLHFKKTPDSAARLLLLTHTHTQIGSAHV